MNLIKCSNCGEMKEHQAKGLCNRCYKRILWKPKLITCKRCKRIIPLHAKNLCKGCYNFVFHLERNKAWNQKKNFGLDYETYKKLAQKCVICSFDKIVDLHHIDENKKNNFKENLIGLCPNHYKMLHHFQYRKETLNALKNLGYKVLDDIKIDFDVNFKA